MKTVLLWALVILILGFSGFSLYHMRQVRMRSTKTSTHQLKDSFGNIQKKIQKYTWWELTIFIIGIISFFTVLIILFLPLGSGPSTFTTTEKVAPAGSKEFLGAVSHSLNLSITQGKEIQILNNGDAFMSAFLTDIDKAQSSIDIMVYIWEKGEMSRQIFEHLDAKLKEGVDVRIMLDAIGGLGAVKADEFQTYKDLGGKVQVFHSLTIAPWSLGHNQKRNHRRAIVIDGKIAYTGGMAVSDKWLGNARTENEWRDMMFRITGPMAQDIQGSFAELWTSSTGEFLTGEKFFPEIPQTALKDGTLTYISLASTPSADSLALQKFILLSLLGAQEKIYITTPYFLPDPSFRETLSKKAQAGVDVRVLVPNDLNDSKGVRHASQQSYQDLLESGVKIYEYQPTFIHAKAIVIDGEWSVIGSANMDNRSRKLNEENAFGVSDKAFGAALEKVYMDNLAQAKQITLEDWKKRGLLQRIREIFARKFVQQY